MAATCRLKIFTGDAAGTESPAAADADNWNHLNADTYDSTGTYYQSSRITVPASGTAYSYERWMKLEFTGTFNLIENVKAYLSAGTFGTGKTDCQIAAGETDSGLTPTNTLVNATLTQGQWDTSGEAIDITPSNAIDSSGEETDFLITQLRVPSTVSQPGDISSPDGATFTLTVTYDES